jgi:glycosyltransferase involved in cell wall biosynthesis
MENRKYRILHFRKHFERNLPIFINFVRGVDNELFTHSICYIGKDPGYKNLLTDLGYEVIYLGFEKKHMEFFNPLVAVKLAGILREKDIDILHCQKHKPTLYGTLAALFAGNVPVISHVHGLSRTRSWNRRMTNWFILRHVRKIIAVSDSVRSDIIGSNWGIPPEKVVTVKNCIDLKTFDAVTISKAEARLKLGIPEDEIVFGTVGRLAATKGQTYLIEAFAKVREKIRNARLIIVGDGPLFRELEKKAIDSGVSPWVLFTGYRNDIFELLKAFDFFILPSLAEGLSIALLEAMASGLPVIASNVGGKPEVFGICDCGRLVPPRDVNALSVAMLEISALDKHQKKALGVFGRSRIEEEFTTDVMVQKLSMIYASLIPGISGLYE